MDPAQASKYLRVARALRASANDLAELGEASGAYGNAIAIVGIHSVIAYGDALCVAFGGLRSTSGDHRDLLDVLKDVLGSRADEGALRQLLAILDTKDRVSYEGDYFGLADARRMMERVERFATWAEEVYEMRP